MSDIALKTPGVQGRGRLPRPVDHRLHQRAQRRHRVLRPRRRSRSARRRQLSGGAIAGAINQQLGGDPGRVHRRVPAAAGERPRHHRRLQAADRGPRRPRRRGALRRDEGDADRRRGRRRSSRGVFSSFQINVPQLYADVDRAKAKRMGVALTDVFDTMQIYLGSLYVNDFNRFGRTYQVVAQADAPYRSRAEDIAQLKTRNAKGEMVPLGSLLRVDASYGPDRAIRYNAFPVGRPERRRRAGLQLGPGAGRDRAHRAGDAAARHHLRVDRPHLPGDPRRQHRGARVPAVRAARVPGARRAVRELHAAARDHPDRADVPAVRDRRRVA